ncbi:S8 family peptidase [Fuscibacter oryzae]|nr:S8 family peptidase [Fuscibacter oryzae]
MVVVLAVLSLGACKGGGSAGGTDLPPLTPGGSGTLGSYYVLDFSPWESIASGVRSSARYVLQQSTWHFSSAPSVEYTSNPLAAARIDYAHAVGLTGKGQTIAVSDGGFNTRHEVFSGKSVTITGQISPDDHGTMVASVAAGNSAKMTGVAPGADLIVGAFDTTSLLAQTGTRALQMGAVAWNNSWGYTNTPVNQTSLSNFFTSQADLAYLASLRAYAAQGVVVFALSNDETDTNSDLMAALPMFDGSLQDGWLAVGNAVPTFDSTQILSATRLSAGCLEAAEWCLVADGAWTGAQATSNTAYDFATGSSFAAPQVSGALALLAEAFPSLTPHQLRIRLLAAADNGFFAADGSTELAPGFFHDYSTEYGHGFLNVKAALMPIGVAQLSVDGQAIPLPQATVFSGSGVGDAVAASLASQTMTVVDSLAGDFSVPAKVLSVSAAPVALSARLAENGRQAVSGNSAVADAGVEGFATFRGTEVAMEAADSPISVRVLLPAGGDGSLGLAVTRHFGDGTSGLDLGLKLTRDGGEVFGLGDGAHGSGTAAASITLGLRGALGQDGFVRVGAEFGLAAASGSGALTDVGQVAFNSLGVDLGQSNLFSQGDRLTIGIDTPVTVTAGHGTTHLPLRSVDGITRMSALDVGLAPDSREMDLKLSYQVPLNERTNLRLDLVRATNYGNRAGVTEAAGALSVRIAF